jgi:acid phosphatase
MRSSATLRPSLLLASLLLTACAATAPRVSEAPAAALTPAHDNLNAALWMQSSAEYAAVVRGAYNQARRTLDLALVTPDWDALPPSERPIRSGFEALPPAIIVDADETLIDNSPFQARGVRDDEPFSAERWQAWSNERRARALPGALEFTRYAADRGVTVYFVTNRAYAGELDATADNLLALGFPVLPDRSNLLLKGDPRAAESAKATRRGYVAARHRVLLLLGDQLGDFFDGAGPDAASRLSAAAAYQSWWGERWVMLPNPAYGDWERVLTHDCPDELVAADRRACLVSALRMH